MKILVTAQPDLYYLTNINLDGFWLYDNYILLTPLLYSQIKRIVNDKYTFLCTENMLKSLKKLKSIIKSEKITVDINNLSVSTLKLLKKVFKTVECSQLLQNKRLIKSNDEIKLIKKSCNIAKKIMKEIIKNIKPHMSELDISDMIKRKIVENSMEPAFNPIVASGENSAYPHHIASNRRIQENDIVIIDLGCKYKNYCSDLTRTIFIGNIPNELRKIYSLVKKIQKEVINSIRPNMKASELHEVPYKIAKEHGYEKYFLHSTGHSIGLEIHEDFRINMENRKKIKEGMTLTIEPGIYIEGLGGVRFEDVVLVTKKGAKIF